MDKNNKIQEPQQLNKNIWKLKKWAIVLAIFTALWWWRKLNDKYQEYLNSQEVPVKVYNKLWQLYAKDEIVWSRWVSLETAHIVDWEWLLSDLWNNMSKILPDKIAKSIWWLDDQIDTVKLSWIIQFGIKNIVDSKYIRYNYNNPQIDKIEITMPDPAIISSMIDFTKSNIDWEENKILWNTEKIEKSQKEYKSNWWNGLREKQIQKVFQENQKKITQLCLNHIVHTVNIYAWQSKHTNELQIIIKNEKWKIIDSKKYPSNHQTPAKENMINYIKKAIKKYYN